MFEPQKLFKKLRKYVKNIKSILKTAEVSKSELNMRNYLKVLKNLFGTYKAVCPYSGCVMVLKCKVM